MKQKTFRCEKCGKIYTIYAAFRQHKQIHATRKSASKAFGKDVILLIGQGVCKSALDLVKEFT